MMENAPQDDGKEERKSVDKWAWVVLLSCFVTSFIAEGIMSSFSVFYVTLLDIHEESKSLTSWIGSFQIALVHILGIVVGSLVSRFGCRALINTGGILTTAGFILSSFMTSIQMLYLTYGVVTGIGVSLIFIPGVTATQTYFETKRSFASGFSSAGSGLGIVAMVPFVQYCQNQYGLYYTLWYMACISINMAVFGSLVFPIPDSSKENKTMALQDANVQNSDVQTTTVEPTENKQIQKYDGKTKSIYNTLGIYLLKNKPFSLFCLVWFLTEKGLLVPKVFLLDVTDEKGIESQEASFLISIMGISDLIWRLLFGLCGDCTNRSGRIVIQIVACFGRGLANCALPFLSTYWSFVVYSIIHGGLKGVTVALFPVIICDIVGKPQVEKGIGICFTLIGFTALLAVPFLAWLADVSGGYMYTYLVSGTLEIIGGFVTCGLLFALNHTQQTEQWI